MRHTLARFFMGMGLLLLGLPVHAQHDPCLPSGVLRAFHEAVQANTVDAWAQSYADCPTDLQHSVNTLAQSYASLHFQATVLEMAPHSDGTIDAGKVPFAEALAVRQFTLEAWVYPQATNPDWQVIVAKEGGQGYSRSFGLFITPDTWQVHGSVMGSDCFENIAVYSAAPLLPELWQHIALTYDGELVRLYLNGVLSGERAYANLICQSEQPLYIGYHPSIFTPFEGQLSEIRLWGRALTPRELNNQRYSVLTGTENGLVGYWRLNDDSQSDSLHDAAGGRHAIRYR